ncbi:GNAT family N-acetyltransferase [Actinoplanes sp. NBRC 101535]|uniref:GNAT family N-acetyltransferase n=1 Tax=Actinoplanes sp. NBRC 101535 TaxID=3032196 RepID=UPI0024A0D4B4|nr:GNAT family N-acetyltransferase [Actinoplanes sp. NBRC 101535]GLY00998.1 acetyltransferase [Actinoplanes sp. NBRC 101535]
MPSLVTPALPAGTLAALEQPVLDGADGVRLRPWRESDVPAVVNAFADPGIQRWHCRTLDEDEAREWLARWPRDWHAEVGASWAVLSETATRQDSPGTELFGSVAGQIGLRRIDLEEGLAAISYWVVPAARGHRIASRALAALTGWAFGTLGLHRLELSHSTANPASCRVAARSGFTAEGVRRSEARHADGWHDMHVHARVHSD